MCQYLRKNKERKERGKGEWVGKRTEKKGKKERVTWCTVFADFCDVTTLTTAVFKLPTCCLSLKQDWGERHTALGRWCWFLYSTANQLENHIEKKIAFTKATKHIRSTKGNITKCAMACRDYFSNVFNKNLNTSENILYQWFGRINIVDVDSPQINL